jgi:hypothetical protein
MSAVWKIRKTHTKDQPPLTEVVYSVEYFVVSTETGKMVFNGNVELQKPVPENFISFEALTNADILRWVKGSIGETMIEDIEKLVQEAEA